MSKTNYHMSVTTGRLTLVGGVEFPEDPDSILVEQTDGVWRIRDFDGECLVCTFDPDRLLPLWLRQDDQYAKPGAGPIHTSVSDALAEWYGQWCDAEEATVVPDHVVEDVWMAAVRELVGNAFAEFRARSVVAIE